MNDSSEIATTHVLRALAYPIATWCTPHDGSHQNRREFSRFPVSGRCKVLQSGASIPASFPTNRLCDLGIDLAKRTACVKGEEIDRAQRRRARKLVKPS